MYIDKHKLQIINTYDFIVINEKFFILIKLCT